ncbi:DNA ligase D [Sphingomonas sp. SM33]|uniref:DNA ligase (ATP) n=1 Tax=Sphingomonas telluris TaxID=2907998 RepID=A0ABS9VMT2_9SPHN|nr:DNA ligase D [Sphingomonas telluris]MCH8616275.1 DNA ligase D [Sphingomonas telluris]
MAKRAGLDIETYNQKRDFTKTKEPKGRRLKGSGDSFVVQKHDASHLHWDFRLELDGVLKSWAVPKGPSVDPGENRLAMRTEDHPLDYGSFEGTIPAGEYGGGTVMLWDHGRWIPHPDKDPRKTIEEGHLHFTLEGERMKGEWVMFRLKPRPGDRRETWMLKKVTDEFANPEDGDELVDEAVTSVTTGRTMAEIASGTDVWRSNRGGQKGGRAKKKSSEAPPPFRNPQLATLVDEVPAGSNWLFEYKYDGYRLLMATGSGAATAWTRNGKDWSDKFRALVKAAANLPAGCLIDGEAVALNDDGKPDFQLLQSTLKDSRGKNLAFYAFDLLVDRGEDITRLPNIERKDRLKSLLAGIPAPILFGDHVLGRGDELFREICKAGGEGVIAKLANAPYRGDRSRNWLKIKCIQRQEFVIIGWSESDKRRGFRSLLLATRDGRKLSYAGKVGTGFNAALIEDLMERMEPLATGKAAVEVPRPDRKGAHWIEPKLVAEINFTEFTSDGVLRHPSFIALREDKPAAQVVREVPKHLEETSMKSKAKPPSRGKAKLKSAEDFGIEISSPERIIYPELGLTKKDLADYYATIEPLIMLDAADRPMTLIRCPGGRTGECFFQKHDKGTFGPDVKQVPIEEKDGHFEDYLYFDDIRGLLACVQMGTMEFHGWGSKVDNVEYPDRLVFDLDPDEGLDFGKVKDAAVRVRDLVGEMGLESFPLLTGGKGIHVVVPLDATADWTEVKSFADRFSRAVSESEPERFTANIRKVQRKGRIFLDWLRNQRGATAVMPYSARAREGAPVAAPIAWDELKDFDSGHAFSILDAGELLRRAKLKKLAGWGKATQSLPDA